MARRSSRNGFSVLAGLPWPAGILVGVFGFLAFRYLPAWWFSRGGQLTHGMGSQLGETLSPLAWVFLAFCWIAALASYLGARRRRRLLETTSLLESLASRSWHEFEMLVGEAFRQHGYSVEETGLGGADGGIDLILRKQGRKVLVQCKQWRRRQIGVSVVREMAGLLAHHSADEVKIVGIGSFTRDAQAFAAGKPVELISGEALLRMIQAVQQLPAGKAAGAPRVDPVFAPHSDASVPAHSCPRCGGVLVQRTNGRTGEQFYGCSTYPRCRGTAVIS